MSKDPKELEFSITIGRSCGEKLWAAWTIADVPGENGPRMICYEAIHNPMAAIQKVLARLGTLWNSYPSCGAKAVIREVCEELVGEPDKARTFQMMFVPSQVDEWRS